MQAGLLFKAGSTPVYNFDYNKKDVLLTKLTLNMEGYSAKQKQRVIQQAVRASRGKGKMPREARVEGGLDADKMAEFRIKSASVLNVQKGSEIGDKTSVFIQGTKKRKRREPSAEEEYNTDDDDSSHEHR